MPVRDNDVVPGLYRWSRGGLFEVIGTARSWSTAGNTVVVYRKFHGRSIPEGVVRELLYMPAPRFLEDIAWPDGTTGPNFSFVTQNLTIAGLLDALSFHLVRPEELR